MCEGFDTSELDKKIETGKYNRNFNIFKRIINLHCIIGGGGLKKMSRVFFELQA
jgi:hypothetical protein